MICRNRTFDFKAQGNMIAKHAEQRAIKIRHHSRLIHHAAAGLDCNGVQLHNRSTRWSVMRVHGSVVQQIGKEKREKVKRIEKLKV